MAAPADCSTLSSGVSTQSTYSGGYISCVPIGPLEEHPVPPPRAPAAGPGKRRPQPWLGGEEVWARAHRLQSPLSPPSYCPGLVRGKGPSLQEGRERVQKPLRASEEPANESQLTHLTTRLTCKGPNTARLDLNQQSQKHNHCVR